ncbi:YfbM family protein [Prosthecobacter sp.]|uniref:YfbM family protein n=1 Tax=Prosthecobacter sp. TaxID=1965333 RepID=UPI003784A1A6
MSMIGHLARIPDDVRVLLHEEPERIYELLYPDWGKMTEEKPGFFARLFGRKNAEDTKAEKIAIKLIAEEDTLDIDKTWHALHFLFTGFAWEGGFPAGFLVSCGEPVGDADMGYGPARSFTAAEVKQIAGFLANLDRAALRGRFKPALMEKMEIYPSIWGDGAHLEDEWAYFAEGLNNTIEFVTEAAGKNLSLLVYIS